MMMGWKWLRGEDYDREDVRLYEQELASSLGCKSTNLRLSSQFWPVITVSIVGKGMFILLTDVI